MKISKIILLTGLLSSGMVSSAHAGGVALGATRVIYPAGDKQVSLSLSNSSDKDTFLIQSWVTSSSGNKSNDFVITPPLFVMQPKKENTLRIMYVGPDLPTDRESVFYLNSKAIPSTDHLKAQTSSLQIATQSVIKLFVRPKNLPSLSIDAPKGLRCKLSGNKVIVTNPSPYYVTLVQFYVGGKKLPNSMVSPKNTLSVDIPENGGKKITFQTINDFGGNTQTQTCAE